MINHIYQLVSPKSFMVKYSDISFNQKVVVRPEYMAICHADQRYFLGQRDIKVLNEKLPMALIHECCGKVVFDPTGNFKIGQRVVLIPNVPSNNNNEIFENYDKGSHFLSSGYDGFMQEFVELSADRIVSAESIEPAVAAISEFVSVAVHATTRFDKLAHNNRERIGVWGDGSLAYTVANVLRARFPKSKICVVGMDRRKLSQFTFVDETYIASEVPAEFEIDHAFECCGGEGSFYAIEDVIKYINPQGSLVLMGVSENKVAINTRMVLEKGLTLIGCSRSGRDDFEKAVEILSNPIFQKRMKIIIFEDAPICSVNDIARAFTNDLTTPFKTVFKWNL